MGKLKKKIWLLPVLFLLYSCPFIHRIDRVSPVIVTEQVAYDTDDPAIWVNPADSTQSLIVGTDKNTNGSLIVFDLNGIIDNSKTIPLGRPNNVDIEYGFSLDGSDIDIAVVTVRMTQQIRIFRLPDMTAVDNGGIDVFAGEADREPMGIALYKRGDGEIFAIVGRKTGPSGTYLFEYQLADSGSGYITATEVRQFGLYSGLKEIESIAVDDELGYVYYSDEMYGVRKYWADPDHANAADQITVFGLDDFKRDIEGISIYNTGAGTGYILVSDQQDDSFCIYRREGEGGNPDNHLLIKRVYLSTHSSDGSDVTGVYLNDTFQHGLFTAMSTDLTFQYYRWEDIAGTDLDINP